MSVREGWLGSSLRALQRWIFHIIFAESTHVPLHDRLRGVYALNLGGKKWACARICRKRKIWLFTKFWFSKHWEIRKDDIYKQQNRHRKNQEVMHILSLFLSLSLSLFLSLSIYLSIYKYNIHQPLGCLVDSAFSVTSAELAPIYWSWSAARSAKSLNATAKEMVSFISLHYLYALFHSVVAFPPGESAVPLRIPVTLA